MKQAQTTQIYIPLNHWSSLQELLSRAPQGSVVLVKSFEQQLFVKELAPHCRVVRSAKKLAKNNPVYLWPFEYLEQSEDYFQLCAQGATLFLLSWAWSEEQACEWQKRALLCEGEVLRVRAKQWRPSLGEFWFSWSQKRWQELLCWGHRLRVFYADENDLRELKRFTKAQQIAMAKKSFCRLQELHWRVPLNEEQVVFTHKASQTVEFRYFQGFQRRPQRHFYLLQYARLWLEKLMAPLRLI